MKMTKKAFALLLTLAMCVVMSTSAFAAGPASEFGPYYEKTYDLGNGIVVTVTTAPNDITPMPLDSDSVLEALAAPTARHSFLLERGEGSRCTAHVWNDSKDDTKLLATFSVTINGKTTPLPSEEVSPQ